MSYNQCHPVAKIFFEAVLAPESNFKFNHLHNFWDSINCNLLFPQKNGFNSIYYDDPDFPEHLKNTDMIYYYPPHPDKNKSFFFWKDYYPKSSYEEHKDNPEYITSNWRLFELDGTANFWNGDKSDYSKERWSLRPNYDDNDLLKPPIENVPIACFSPNNETATDYHRRELYYRKEKCSWALIDDCNCSESSVCSKIENMIYGESNNDEGNDSNYFIPTMISLGTDVNSLLGARMAALDTTEPPTEPPTEPEYDEYMYTLCTA